jgi:plastocyanin
VTRRSARRCALCAAVAGGVLAVALLSSHADAQPRPAKTHTVTIDGTAYTPATVTVPLGDQVVWVNRDPFAHTVTSREAGLDSKDIEAEKSWSIRPHTKGRFTYTCTRHPSMTGTLVVE